VNNHVAPKASKKICFLTQTLESSLAWGASPSLDLPPRVPCSIREGYEQVLLYAPADAAAHDVDAMVRKACLPAPGVVKRDAPSPMFAHPRRFIPLCGWGGLRQLRR
jgi:hypothetical protein